MAGKKNFEGLDPIFGEAVPECEQSPSSAADGGGGGALRPFLFYVHAPDPSRLSIVASDFHSLTWERSLTVHELDDLRDDIGIGGLWSEFVDYLIASLSSGDVKLVLGSIPDVKVASGIARAKLVAHKSKGLPRITLPLNRVMDPLANDAMANLSLALFKSFKTNREDFVKEQVRLQRLKGILSSERERSESLQKQLDSISFLSKRKGTRLNDKENTVSGSTGNHDTVVVTEIQEPSDISSTRDPQPTKINRRVAPVSRRAKVRGVSLKDDEDTDDI